MKKILDLTLSALIIFFSCLLAVCLLSYVQKFISGKDYNSFLGYSIFEITTGSMAGELEIGDWIIVKKENNVELGDVVTFQEDNNFITHRVIEKYNNKFITRGDFNNKSDEAITDEKIIGTVILKVPKFGIIKKVLFNPKILVLLIVIFFLIFSIFADNGNVANLLKLDYLPKNSIINYKKDTRADDCLVDIDVDVKNENYVKEMFSGVDNSEQTILLSKISVQLNSSDLDSLASTNEILDDTNLETIMDVDDKFN